MLLALADRPELTLHVVHDERAAGFVALGLGLSGSPAIVLCTSGTAAANLHPAVVEAGLSGVPMLVFTADRPAELRDVGAPQTIDQTNLYGRAVRWFHDPGIADEAAASTWRSLGRRLVDAAGDGPVHLNLPFREPLVADAGPLPPRRTVPASSCGERARRVRRPRRAARPRTRRRARRRRLATGPDVDVRRGDRVAGARRSAVAAPRARRGGRGVRRPAPPRTDGGRAAARGDRSRRSARGVQGARPVGGRFGSDAGAGGRCRHDRSGSHGGRPCRWRRPCTARPAARRRRRSGVAAAVDRRRPARRGGDRRRARPGSAAQRAVRGAHGCPGAAAGCRARRRLVDAGARPRVVRRTSGASARQPRGERHRRGRVDGARCRAARGPDGRPGRRHRLRPRRRRAHRAPVAAQASTCASS